MKTSEGLRIVPAGTPGAVPLLPYAIRNAGTVKGARAMSFLYLWAIARHRLGHELGEEEGGGFSAAVREYTAYWNQSERTTWRDVKAWQLAFPGEQSPARLALQLTQAYALEKAKRTDAFGHAAGIVAMAA